MATASAPRRGTKTKASDGGRRDQSPQPTRAAAVAGEPVSVPVGAPKGGGELVGSLFRLSRVLGREAGIVFQRNRFEGLGRAQLFRASDLKEE